MPLFRYTDKKDEQSCTAKIRHILMYQSKKSQRKYDVSMQGYIRIHRNTVGALIMRRSKNNYF